MHALLILALAQLGSLTLTAARPLPDPRDQAEGQRATQCVFLYRLQATEPGVDSRTCEAQGYGLEFMRERWAEIDALQKKKAEAIAHAREEGRLNAEAQAQRAALTEPCRAYFEDGLAAPDGGEPWCDRAGLSRGYFNRLRYRERARAEQDQVTTRNRVWSVIGVVVLLAVVVGLVRSRRRS